MVEKINEEKMKEIEKYKTMPKLLRELEFILIGIEEEETIKYKETLEELVKITPLYFKYSDNEREKKGKITYKLERIKKI